MRGVWSQQADSVRLLGHMAVLAFWLLMPECSGSTAADDGFVLLPQSALKAVAATAALQNANCEIQLESHFTTLRDLTLTISAINARQKAKRDAAVFGRSSNTTSIGRSTRSYMHIFCGQTHSHSGGGEVPQDSR